MPKRWYKRCRVVNCANTTKRTPEKLFICVPYSVEIRKKWLRLAGRDPATLSMKTTMYFCEDHFDLPNDMQNYTQYKIMGEVGMIRMRPGCLPFKFECHNYNKNKRKIESIGNEKELENSETTQRTKTTKNATSDPTFTNFQGCFEETIPRLQRDIKIEPVEDLSVTLEELERDTTITQKKSTQETKTTRNATNEPSITKFEENMQCVEEAIPRVQGDIKLKPDEDLMITLEENELGINMVITQGKSTQEIKIPRNVTIESTFTKFEENMQCVEETIPQLQTDIKIEPVEDLNVTLEELERDTQKISTQGNKTKRNSTNEPTFTKFEENMQCVDEAIPRVQGNIKLEPVEDLMITLEEKELDLNMVITQGTSTQETKTLRNVTSEPTVTKFQENMQCVEETIPRLQKDIKIEPVEDLNVTLEELEKDTTITQKNPTQETKTTTYAVGNRQCIEETIANLHKDTTIEPVEDLMVTLEDIEAIKYKAEESSIKEIQNTDNDKNEINELFANKSGQDGDNKYTGRRTAMKIAWKKNLNTRRATFNRNDYVITYYLP